MAEYAITFSRSARKEIEQLNNPLLGRVLARIESLAREPRPPGCVKLEGKLDLWRVRAGDYRVVYSVDDVRRVVNVTICGHRGDIYR